MDDRFPENEDGSPLIMVDELSPCPNAKDVCFRKGGACHLTVHGSIDALHAFAKRIGMKRIWFQDHPRHPHYDLTAKRRAVALEYGALFVPAKTQARARLRLAGVL